MKKTDLSQAVLQKIKKEKIKPLSRRYWQMREVFWWFLIFSQLMIGSLAVAVSILYLSHWDFVLAKRAVGNTLQYLVSSTPLIWPLLLLGSVLFVEYGFGRTKKGFRFRRRNVILVTVLTSVFFGVMLYNFRIAEHVDKQIAKYWSFYDDLSERKMRLWTRPDEGFLFGVPLLPAGDEKFSNFSLLDPEGNFWRINSPDLTTEEREILFLSDKVRLLGSRTARREFRLCRVLPEKGPPGKRFFERNFPCEKK